MREYRLTITVRELGHADVAEGNMERLLEAFESDHPRAGAVVGANYHLNRLDATFTVEANDAREATARGSAIFADAARAASFEAPEVIEMNAVCVSEATVEEADRELAGAR